MIKYLFKHRTTTVGPSSDLFHTFQNPDGSSKLAAGAEKAAEAKQGKKGENDEGVKERKGTGLKKTERTVKRSKIEL